MKQRYMYEYLYRSLNVKLMKLEGDSVGFWISIPILAGEYYTLWKVLTVPFPDKSGHSQIEPEATNIGVGLNSGRIIETDFCLYENPTLCPGSIKHRSFIGTL